MVDYPRTAGILLHPTSLPGRYGIGDIGPEAYKWIDFLHDSGMRLWQILPIGPTGYADSPYQSFSAFAGNYYWISPYALQREGLLAEGDLEDIPDFPMDHVDYGEVIAWKMALLKRSYQVFKQSGRLEGEFEKFCAEEGEWLVEYALFMSLKDAHDLEPWVNWAPELRQREPKALQKARKKYAESIQRYMYYQFLFFRQWQELHKYAMERGVRVIGDIPIYIAHDSVDVWLSPELYYLDEDGQPTVVAGVPPDFFSETGQLWGNPIYRWDVHADNRYEWWIERFRHVFQTVDIVRLDHFRGFAGYWEVPGGDKTAQNGRWVEGPGADLFNAVKDALGELPIIVEDLGVITDDVVALREQFGFPGMKILQFAFDGDANHPYLPHGYSENTVAYTGTHDNEPVMAWYRHTNEDNKHHARVYLRASGEHIAWDMVEALWNSPAVMVLAPMQDILELGEGARMNKPGTTDDNWAWRLLGKQVDEPLQQSLLQLNKQYNRIDP